MNSSTIIRAFNNACKGKQQWFRTIKNMSSTASASAAQIQKDIETFQDVLPTVYKHVLTRSKLAEYPQVADWTKRMLEYNLAGGKKFRGLTTVLAYEMVEKPENLNEESLRNARLMGWCVEMLQAYLLMLDDLMDGSTTRRGAPCWYRVPGVGLGVITDSLFVYTTLFDILRAHFSSRVHYNKILNLFNETVMYTCMGQHLDCKMTQRDRNDYSKFTMEQYLTIIRYKSSYYTYKLPVSLGLLLAGNANTDLHQRTHDISMELGELFQIQDDIIDCFGDASVSGKIGSDIQEGKCTWLSVMALQRCTPAQRVVFEACYGSSEPAHVERVKQLYEQLNLPQLFQELERSKYDFIVNSTNDLPDSLSSLMRKLLTMIYKRKQ